MATFTTFTEEALVRYLTMFRLGELTSFEAIEEGIENSNYFVSIDLHGVNTDYVLSIIEQLDLNDLPFFNQVLQHLFYYGLPVPAPKPTLDGMTTTLFCGKPTLLFPRLEGVHLEDVDETHCRAIGNALGDIHVTLATQDWYRANPYSPEWMETTLVDISSKVSADDLTMVNQITNDYETAQELSLPAGIVHGDLFRDNVLFENNEVSGILDFFHACNDFFVQDIAITINDWCREDATNISETRRTALIEGYSKKRELTEMELEHLPAFQTFSAARFALTRLISGDQGEYLKDPDEFLDLTRELVRQSQGS
ncbi:MAG TPA: homoserine kinase [Gammaproteobacteria bacterium]|nr:homoserine kinase [Gammaproteobacteria bacterium]